MPYGSGILDFSKNEVGELNGKTNFHYPFKLNNINLFNKQSYIMPLPFFGREFFWNF